MSDTIIPPSSTSNNYENYQGDSNLPLAAQGSSPLSGHVSTTHTSSVADTFSLQFMVTLGEVLGIVTAVQDQLSGEFNARSAQEIYQSMRQELSLAQDNADESYQLLQEQAPQRAEIQKLEAANEMVDAVMHNFENLNTGMANLHDHAEGDNLASIHHNSREITDLFEQAIAEMNEAIAQDRNTMG